MSDITFVIIMVLLAIIGAAAIGALARWEERR